MMRSNVSTTIEKWLAGLIMISLFAILGVTAAHAASYSDPVEVKVPYTHSFETNVNRSGDTFTYQIKPVGNAPAPRESKDGAYYFEINPAAGGGTVSGQVDMKIVFARPGDYVYKVSAYVPKEESGYTYDKSEYELHVYVKNKSGGGLKALVAVVDKDGDKQEGLTLKSGYRAEGTTRPISTPEGTPTDDEPSDTPGDPTPGDDEPTDTPGGTTPDDDRPANTPANPGGGNTPANPGNGNGTANPGNGNGAANPAAGAGAGGILGTGIGVNDDGNLVDEDVPMADIINNAVPKANPERGFLSLLDLILALGSVILAGVMLWRYFERIDTAEDEYIIRRNGKLRLLSLIPAMTALWVFLFTQDMTLPKKFLPDEWTVFQAAAFGVNLALGLVIYKVYSKEENSLHTGSYR